MLVSLSSKVGVGRRGSIAVRYGYGITVENPIDDKRKPYDEIRSVVDFFLFS